MFHVWKASDANENVWWKFSQLSSMNFFLFFEFRSYYWIACISSFVPSRSISSRNAPRKKIELLFRCPGIVCLLASKGIKLLNDDRKMERIKASIRIINYIKASPFLITDEQFWIIIRAPSSASIDSLPFLLQCKWKLDDAWKVSLFSFH